VSIRRGLFAIAGIGLSAAVLPVAVLSASSASASASATVPGAPAAGAAAVSPATGTATLHACYYEIKATGTHVWEFPGGSSRRGNRSYAKTIRGVDFNSIPYILSPKVYGQQWVYGALHLASGSVYGWVGRSSLIQNRCLTNTFQTTNTSVAKTGLGDPFSSEPYAHTGNFRGQNWVYGIDPFASKRAGWVGRNDLKESSCNSSGCFYDISARNIHEWILPGGSNGP
jgi:hypothetical protein